jgi:hypothetical protein
LNVDDAKERIKQAQRAEWKRLESNRSTNLKGLLESMKKYVDDEVNIIKDMYRTRTAGVVCAYKADENVSDENKNTHVQED